MKTTTEYRPGKWALLEAGAVVGTTADPTEAAVWAAPMSRDMTGQDHAGPAYLWLEGPAGADLQTVRAWWGLALASWRRRSGRADGLPAVTMARPDLVQALRQVAPAAVRLVESQTVQRGTVWLGPVASEVRS